MEMISKTLTVSTVEVSQPIYNKEKGGYETATTIILIVGKELNEETATKIIRGRLGKNANFIVKSVSNKTDIYDMDLETFLSLAKIRKIETETEPATPANV